MYRILNRCTHYGDDYPGTLYRIRDRCLKVVTSCTVYHALHKSHPTYEGLSWSVIVTLRNCFAERQSALRGEYNYAGCSCTEFYTGFLRVSLLLLVHILLRPAFPICIMETYYYCLFKPLYINESKRRYPYHNVLPLPWVHKSTLLSGNYWQGCIRSPYPGPIFTTSYVQFNLWIATYNVYA